MADWKDNFREGSFRGVQFFTESHQETGGRRKQDREFAKRETGNSEDLGKRLKNFTLEIFVMGDDYFTQRDDLVKALDGEGPGVLRHPYRGVRTVQAGNYTLTETVGEGRLARFSVEFTEAGEVKFPDQAEDDLLNATNNANAAIENSSNLFEQALDTVGQAAFVIQAAADDVAALVDNIESAITAVTEPVANLTFAIRNLKADINDLIQLPGELAGRITSVFDDLLAEFEDDPETSEKILGNFNSTLDDNFTPAVGDTPSRETQRGNQTAVQNFGNQVGLSNQAKAAVEVEFTSTEAALESRNAVVEGLDLQLDLADDDDLFQSIKDLQTSLTKAVPAIGTSELISFTPVSTTPAIVIAHDLFEDLDKETEIIEQNNIEHPGFVPGGDEIQVSAG